MLMFKGAVASESQTVGAASPREQEPDVWFRAEQQSAEHVLQKAWLDVFSLLAHFGQL